MTLKIADPTLIKSGERILFEAIKERIDVSMLEELIKDKFSIDLLDFKKGDIVVHNGQVAYQLDFELKIGLSLLCDREGKYLPGTPASSLDPSDETFSDEPPLDPSEDDFTDPLVMATQEAEPLDQEKPLIAEDEADTVTDEGMHELSDVDDDPLPDIEVLDNLATEEDLAVLKNINDETGPEKNNPSEDAAAADTDPEFPDTETDVEEDPFIASVDRELEAALQQNSTMWAEDEQASSASPAQSEAPEAKTDLNDEPPKVEEDLTSILKRNQDFWTAQAQLAKSL